MALAPVLAAPILSPWAGMDFDSAAAWSKADWDRVVTIVRGATRRAALGALTNQRQMALAQVPFLIGVQGATDHTNDVGTALVRAVRGSAFSMAALHDSVCRSDMVRRAGGTFGMNGSVTFDDASTDQLTNLIAEVNAFADNAFLLAFFLALADGFDRARVGAMRGAALVQHVRTEIVSEITLVRTQRARDEAAAMQGGGHDVCDVCGESGGLGKFGCCDVCARGVQQLLGDANFEQGAPGLVNGIRMAKNQLRAGQMHASRAASSLLARASSGPRRGTKRSAPATQDDEPWARGLVDPHDEQRARDAQFSQGLVRAGLDGGHAQSAAMSRISNPRVRSNLREWRAEIMELEQLKNKIHKDVVELGTKRQTIGSLRFDASPEGERLKQIFAVDKTLERKIVSVREKMERATCGSRFHVTLQVGPGTRHVLASPSPGPGV